MRYWVTRGFLPTSRARAACRSRFGSSNSCQTRIRCAAVMNSAMKSQPVAGHGNGFVLTQYHPSWSPAASSSQSSTSSSSTACASKTMCCPRSIAPQGSDGNTERNPHLDEHESPPEPGTIREGRVSGREIPGFAPEELDQPRPGQANGRAAGPGVGSSRRAEPGSLLALPEGQGDGLLRAVAVDLQLHLVARRVLADPVAQLLVAGDRAAVEADDDVAA